MTIPNVITIARLLLVPLVVWALLGRQVGWALAAFALAGASDGVDGFIARQFNQRSQLGACLDPLADKLLLVSVFVMLGYMGALPAWLVILAVSRDALILCAVVLSNLMGHPVAMRPLLVSKANTAVQIGLAAIVLADLAFGLGLADLCWGLAILSGALTVASAAAYLLVWLTHMDGYAETDNKG